MSSNNQMVLVPIEWKELVESMCKQISQTTFQMVYEQLQKDKGDELVTAKDACKMLKISAPTLASWERAGRIKGTQVGKRKYFQYADLMGLAGNTKYKRA